MFPVRALHGQICASCRLRAILAGKRVLRTRKTSLSTKSATWRAFTTSSARFQDAEKPEYEDEIAQARLQEHGTEFEGLGPEEAARRARVRYGEFLPPGVLDHEGRRAYERFFGTPVEAPLEEEEGVQEDVGTGTGVLREGEGGVLEEVEFDVLDEEEEEDVRGGVELQRGDERLAADIHATVSVEDGMEEEGGGEMYLRTHPLTQATKFTTSPSTLAIPRPLADPIATQLAHVSNTHLKQAAHTTFHGPGLPASTSTPSLAKPLEQRPIPLHPGQNSMTEREGDVFMGVLVPGIYASVMSVLVETRKKLGTAWAEAMVRKAERGDFKVLDAGGGGAGLAAVREVLRAEWERMYEVSDTGVVEAGGRAGGSAATPPLGQGTVLAGSEALRKRASALLEDTTFIPRLPDYAHTESARKKGKFDIVVAPHTLWGLKEDYLRKRHLRNLYSLVSADGGVLVLVEKGVARGFETIASARQMVLDEYIHPAGGKDPATILAPCTTHAPCPMWVPPGQVKGRRDICHFSQRYTRPPFLQTILGARDKNFEDVKFSYLSLVRGRDLLAERGVVQDDAATDAAFEGLEDSDPGQVEALTLPRAVLPPLKRRGHVIFDFCTPAGKLERWTVPRSYGRRTFRDARKASWGDLWGLGAKSRVSRTPKVKKRKSDDRGEGGDGGEGGLEWGGDTFDQIVGEQGLEGGKMRRGRVKGVRDKRDKKGEGNGRRRNRVDVGRGVGEGE